MTNELVLALVPIVLAVLVALGRKWVAVNVSPKQLAAVMDLAKTAIEAAEKEGRELKLDGKAKYALASDALKALGRRVGLKLTDQEVHALIHSVLQQFDELDGIRA